MNFNEKVDVVRDRELVSGRIGVLVCVCVTVFYCTIVTTDAIVAISRTLNHCYRAVAIAAIQLLYCCCSCRICVILSLRLCLYLNHFI